MVMVKINEHEIDVPPCMKACLGGMFDAVEYRGIEICTFEASAGPYSGPFGFETEDGVFHVVANLGDAKAMLDSWFDQGITRKARRA